MSITRSLARRAVRREVPELAVHFLSLSLKINPVFLSASPAQPAKTGGGILQEEASSQQAQECGVTALLSGGSGPARPALLPAHQGRGHT